MNARANKYVKALTVSPDGAPAAMRPGAVKPRFFKSGSEFGEWLAKNHDRVTELIVGFYKKNAGKNWVTYHEALDAALAFGWIDGVRRSLDAQRWRIRFTPRSIWCLNMRTAGITKEVRMPVKSELSSLNAPGEVGTPEVLVARFLEYAKVFQFPIAYQ